MEKLQKFPYSRKDCMENFLSEIVPHSAARGARALLHGLPHAERAHRADIHHDHQGQGHGQPEDRGPGGAGGQLGHGLQVDGRPEVGVVHGVLGVAVRPVDRPRVVISFY